jgi:hypothetical protein
MKKIFEDEENEFQARLKSKKVTNQTATFTIMSIPDTKSKVPSSDNSLRSADRGALMQQFIRRKSIAKARKQEKRRHTKFMDDAVASSLFKQSN